MKMAARDNIRCQDKNRNLEERTTHTFNLLDMPAFSMTTEGDPMAAGCMDKPNLPG